MNEGFIFFIIEDDKVMRRIIADFIRQMVRGGELSEDAVYDSSNGEEALALFQSIFKTAAEAGPTYRDEPVTPLPGRQDRAIVICGVEMEPMGGLELLQICRDDEVFRSMNFVMITKKPDLGLVSELGELGVTNILVQPITMEKFSHTVRNMAARLQSDEHGYYKEVERLFELGQYDVALTLLKHVESKYTSLKWVILRGRVHLGLKETERAANDFEQAEMGAHIASVIALKHMVKAHEAAGDTRKTIDSLNKLTLKSPNNVERRLKLAELFISENRKAEAKAVLDSLEMEKREALEIRSKIADLFEKAGYLSDAGNVRLQMVDEQLEDFVFCNNVAIGLRKQGRYESADDIYKKLIKQKPNEAILWFNRAVNLSAWGRGKKIIAILREALDHYRMALKLNPGFSEAGRAIQLLKSDIKSQMEEEGS
ncbi:MAG: tetratricopeptide repeat protein [Syntrophobacteraceae bacterium]